MILQHEFSRELSGLDFFQDAPHFRFRFFRDDARTAGNTTIFSSIRHGVPHIGDTAFVEEIDDQLQFVQTFEVGHLRCVTRFNQRLEPSLHQRGSAAAQHGLLAKQIRFSFFAKRGFDDPRATGTDC